MTAIDAPSGNLVGKSLGSASVKYEAPISIRFELRLMAVFEKSNAGSAARLRIFVSDTVTLVFLSNVSNG